MAVPVRSELVYTLVLLDKEHAATDGAEVTSIAIDNGPMNFMGTDIPPSFSQVRVGWNNYQSAAPGFVAWIDEVALDKNRIGCGN